jgi:hypothetical protein
MVELAGALQDDFSTVQNAVKTASSTTGTHLGALTKKIGDILDDGDDDEDDEGFIPKSVADTAARLTSGLTSMFSNAVSVSPPPVDTSGMMCDRF